MLESILDANYGLYFTGILLMFIAGTVAFTIGLRKILTSKVSIYINLFVSYFAFSIIQTTTSVYFTFHPEDIPFANLDSITAKIFSCLEFLLFTSYIYVVFDTGLSRIIGVIMMVSFPLFCVLYSIASTENEFPYLIFLVESFCLIVPCAIYFFQLFTGVPLENIASQPRFWIVTGLLFYSLTSIPSWLVLKYFYSNWEQLQDIATIGFFSTSLFYTLIIKALLCWETRPT